MKENYKGFDAEKVRQAAPALADLDLDKLEALARSFCADCVTIEMSMNPSDVLNLIALARRAAQPVAPVQAMLADALREIFERRPCDYDLDMQKVRDADMETLMRVHHLFATPAAIAASRRAAGGEPIYQVRRKPMNGATFDWRDVSEERYRTQYVEDEWNEKRVVYATPAPASAGQAAPAMPDGWKVERNGECMRLTDPDGRMTNFSPLGGPSGKLAYEFLSAVLTARPAEGASQAGRQYQRKVDEKIIARRDAEIASLRAGQAGQVTTITDEDVRMLHAVAGYMRRNDSPRCSSDLTKLALKLDAIRNATERAAAPAEQPSAQKGGA